MTQPVATPPAWVQQAALRWGPPTAWHDDGQSGRSPARQAMSYAARLGLIGAIFGGLALLTGQSILVALLIPVVLIIGGRVWDTARGVARVSTIAVFANGVAFGPEPERQVAWARITAISGSRHDFIDHGATETYLVSLAGGKRFELYSDALANRAGEFANLIAAATGKPINPA